MPEFLRLLPPDEARELLLSNLAVFPAPLQTVDTGSAIGRVTAEDILAPHSLPEFIRSSMDGYAVRARDTFGASDSLPSYLQLVGEVPMGAPSAFELQVGQCALIHTGGMLPKGADAVVMIEKTQPIFRKDRSSTRAGLEHIQTNQLDQGAPDPSTPAEIEVLKAVAVGENLIGVGEDVIEGQVVIQRGVRLKPAAIGGLMALGITSLRVVKKPCVAIISSGDEVVDPHEQPLPGQVRDVNSSTLASLISEAGGEPVLHGIISDERQAVVQAAERALAAADMLLISGGSSASARDLTANVIGALGSPGVLVHGISVRPGKPTILAVSNNKAIIGLPGNPVSALVIGYLFVVPLVERLLGLPFDRPRPKTNARLTVNLASQAGREDWWPVRLRLSEGNGYQQVAEPIFGKSNLIFSLAAADGLLRIPSEANGLSAGDLVEIQIL